MRSIITKAFGAIVGLVRLKAFRRLLIASIGAAAFASCTANGNLIYLNIQKTTKTTTGTIPVDITVSEMLAAGAGGTPPYYVAAGKIYEGTVLSQGNTNWGAISVPSANGQDMLCNALGFDGTNLWGGFFSQDGSSVGLFHATPGGTFVPAAGFPGAGKQITYVAAFPITGTVFAVAATMSTSGSFTYQLFFNNGTSWSPLPATLGGVSTVSQPITGIGFDGTNYYATSGNVLYWGTTGTTFNVLFASGNSNDIFRGVFIDPTFNNSGSAALLILVPSSNQTVSSTGVGGIYYSIGALPSQTSFLEIATNANTSFNTGFLCAAGPIDGASTHYTYLVGADSGYGAGFGFFSLNFSNPASPSLSRYSGISYSLYASAVNRILVDSSAAANSANIVAMGTINNGLWVTYPVDTTGSFSSNTWTQE